MSALAAVTPAAASSAEAVGWLVRQQDAEGCVASRVRGPGGTVLPDRNAFVTALVLRALRGCAAPELRQVRSRGLDWLAQARSPGAAGSFAFWPERSRPAWAASVPPDADDTAVLVTELVLGGRIRPHDGVAVVCRALLPYRVRPGGAGLRPPWVRDGCFRTWLARGPANPVDVTVNVNVVALLAVLDARHLPGYAQAVSTILGGLEWAEDRPARLSALTPFYAVVDELAEALRHAVRCGVVELDGAAGRVGLRPPADPERPLLRDAYGRTTWTAPALHVARSLASSSAMAAGWADERNCR